MQVVLALPAYNEAEALPKLLQSFMTTAAAAEWRARVVVVDDGSSDSTAGIATEWSARVPLELIRHGQNRGLGITIQDALRAAASSAQPGDVIVTMDADNTHSPELIPAMLAEIERGNDVVIASRYRTGSAVIGLNALRRLMSFGARLLFQMTLPIPGVRDYTCGFRAYRANILQRAFAGGGNLVQETSFAAMAEILLGLRKFHPRVCEVPMVLHYERKAGPSKMRISTSIMTTLRMIARYRST